LWADHEGNMFITELSCSCRMLSKANDTLYVVAGSFLTEGFSDNTNSLRAYMHYPHGTCMDAAGDLYFADTYNNRIRKTIPVTGTPTFAYRYGQTMTDTNGTTINLGARLAITVLDSGQSETWSMLTAPLHGVMAGFPFSMPSYGTDSLTIPSAGLSYTPYPGFYGSDSCRIMVTNGFSSDTLKVYINTLYPNTTGIFKANAATTEGIAIVPNPATDHFTVTVTSIENHPVDFTLVNTLGQVVKTFTGTTNQPQSQSWNVPQGIYTLHATGNNINLSSKVIKE